MRYINKTISYWKRNGIKKTVSAVLERIDNRAADPMQKKANAYRGRLQNTNAQKPQAQTIRFSIVVPAYETKETFLRQLVDSVLGQTYDNLQLVIADASDTDQVQRVITGYQDDRILYHRLETNGGISNNTNEALSLADGDYIGLLDHDDVLERDALQAVAALLAKHDFDMVYTDEDKMTAGGDVFFEPNYKPDFNMDYLLSNNYICHFTVLRASLIKELRLRPDYDGAQDYDLFLRAVLKLDRLRQGEGGAAAGFGAQLRDRIGHVPQILYHWRAHEDSTADNPESKRYAYMAGMRALEDFLRQAGWKAHVAHSPHLGFYDVTYLPDIFSVRKDVSGIGSCLIKGGRVRKGPLLDGQECFVGMRACYSGYLHRAQLIFEADELPEESLLLREDAGQTGAGRLLYLPPEKFTKYKKMSFQP